MNGKTAEKKFAVKSKRYYALGFSVILAIAFVHFAAQIFFIQNENPRPVETAAETAPPAGQISGDEPAVAEDETSKRKSEKISENAEPQIRRAPKNSRQSSFVPARTAARKKADRESRAERLRRAEQILTGV